MKLFLKFFKFGLVGFSGMLIDFGLTWLIKEKLRQNKYIANSIGFIAAATSNYYWNRVWTFTSKNQDVVQELTSFISVALLGLLINNGILYLLTKKFRFNFYFSKLLAIVVVTFWNFSMNLLVTFSTFQ
jgi:putative flippase GtrA